MSQTQNKAVPCPSCGTSSTGKFCSNCGSAMMGANCASCSALLTPGARFCHRCGTTVGGASHAAPARVPSGEKSVVPWVVAGAALLAMVILVAAQQGRSPAPTIGDAAPLGAEAPFAGGGAVRAPDISNMSPRERADRLYNRVMTMAAAGKADSAAFFASMAVGAYESLSPLDADLRYDYGRMAEMSGALPLAQAQADTILREQPDHLLGLILSARVALARGDKDRSQKLLSQLVAAEKTESAKSLEEYQRHRGDIDAALAEAAKR